MFVVHANDIINPWFIFWTEDIDLQIKRNKTTSREYSSTKYRTLKHSYRSSWVVFFFFGGGVYKVVATFNHVGGSFKSIYGHHRGYLNNPIFSNLGLCAACWARFMGHHELWPTSVSHPFSCLNSCLGFAGGIHYQKITIPIFILVLQNFATPGCFPFILFYCYLFSLLSSGWFVIAVYGSISAQETS